MREGIAAVLVFGLLLACLSARVLAEPPQKLYLLHCWGCHGGDGEGVKGAAPPLVGVGRFLSARGGRAYLIEVPGVAYSPLDDAEVAVVMNWVLDNFSRKSLPADFAPYTTAEVRRYRKTHLPRLARTRERLLEAAAARANGR